ncbi:MAG: hypothetical protein CM1200mP1_07170 [Candidatus Neomarinimicrobiota bacterium]|nr:MAG: hypothetical protein CM1200mP1_07170 [Candidatus Neomarinimicrobiota bacterium]
MTAFSDTLKSQTKLFSVADIDKDGRDEIIMASNGNKPNYGTTSTTHKAYSEDRFIIMGVQGELGIPTWEKNLQLHPEIG